MLVDVVGRHMSLGTDQKAHAEAEARKLAKYFDGINEIKITFEKEHDNLKAEIVCSVSGGKTLVAHESGGTVHESLESASDNMARQIKKHKGRLHARRPARAKRETDETGREPAAEPEEATPDLEIAAGRMELVEEE
jgi:ribosomal subunit interface protein